MSQSQRLPLCILSRRWLAAFLIGWIATTVGTSSEIQADLMVVDSLSDRVLLVSEFDGSIINPSFITDSARFSTIVNAVSSGPNSVFISDQVANAVFEYSTSGTYLRTVVSSGSSNVSNIRGIAVHNNRLYVTVAGGTYANTVQSFRLDGTDQRTFIGSKLDSPWDVYFRGSDVLVSNSGSDDIERFDFNGNYLNTLVSSTGVGGINFPQQINERVNGNLLVGGFSNPFGIYEYLPNGTQVNYYNLPGPRAAYELGNGKYLYSAGTRLAVFDPVTLSSTDIINDLNSSFRYIEKVQAVPEPGSCLLLCGGLVGIVAARFRRQRS
ncbi:MAG: PEP-CTERM sorting domain-containing protein [Planctomycetota bacterium]